MTIGIVLVASSPTMNAVTFAGGRAGFGGPGGVGAVGSASSGASGLFADIRAF